MKDEKTHIKITKRRICCIQEYYLDLQGSKNVDPIMKKAVKLDKRCYGQQMKNQFDITEPPTKSKFRNPGGGKKVTALKVRDALHH